MNIQWSGFNWRVASDQDFNKVYWWQYNSTGLVLLQGSRLELGFIKDFEIIKLEYDLGEETFHPFNACGAIKSDLLNIFNHKFTLRCKLPSGRGMWPAFWLINDISWPPEIDIFEGYSNTGNYKSWFLKPYNVRNCVHYKYGENESLRTNIHSKSPFFWVWKGNPVNNFQEYSVSFYPDRIVFEVNGYKVRTVKDPLILANVFKYPDVRVIINNAVQKEYMDRAEMSSQFVCEWFKYEKI